MRHSLPPQPPPAMEATAPPVRLRIRNALGWPLLALVALLAGAEGARGIHAGVPWSEGAQALWYLGWGFWITRLARRQGGGLRRFLRRPREPRAWAHVGMAIPLFVLSVGVIWLQLVAVSWAVPERLGGWMADDPAQPAAIPLAGVLEVLTAVALAPMVEELAFRGVLLRDWSRRWGRTAAVLATSALFAVLHPADLLGSFAFGVVLATIRFRTRTLIVPVACHALYNALGTLIGAGDPDAGPVDPAAFSLDELRGMWWIGALAVAAALPVVIAFLRRRSRGE